MGSWWKELADGFDEGAGAAAIGGALEEEGALGVEDLEVRDGDVLGDEVAEGGGALPIDDVDAADGDAIGEGAGEGEEEGIELVAGLAPVGAEVEDGELLTGDGAEVFGLARRAVVGEVDAGGVERVEGERGGRGRRRGGRRGGRCGRSRSHSDGGGARRQRRGRASNRRRCRLRGGFGGGGQGYGLARGVIRAGRVDGVGGQRTGVDG